MCGGKGKSGEGKAAEEMKGGVSSYTLPPAKRRWRGLVIAVLGLVLLSMLVPLVFLLGLHNGFHSTSGGNIIPLPPSLLSNVNLLNFLFCRLDLYLLLLIISC